ncbi:MAG: SRPBCC family protein [Dehalococcoidia bacterium]
MKLERTVHIAAPPERICHVMTDVERWPEWTSSVKAVRRIDDGPLRIGSSAEIELRGTPNATWVVKSFEAGRSFWPESQVTPSVAGGHVIEPAGDGADVRLTIQPRGLIATLLSPLIVRMSRANVEAEAEGLSRRGEENA